VRAEQAVLQQPAIVDALHAAGEHLAAGYMAQPGEPPVVRFALGLASLFEHMSLPEWCGEPLYPCANSLYFAGQAVEWHYSSCLLYDEGRLRAKQAATGDLAVRDALEAVHQELAGYPGVGGYTHSIPNYRRILAEGLSSYRERIQRARAYAESRAEPDRIDFCRAMEILLGGVETLHRRAVARVREASPADPDARVQQEALLAALERVPMGPATRFYEALVSVNWILYLDGPDDLGRFDQDLWPFFERDREAGVVTDSQAREWIGLIWENINRTTAWNVALGGRLEDGRSGITDLTRICVEAGRGRRRPNLALRLHRDAPDAIWDAALDSIASGNGLPALYNEEGYTRAIREAHLNLPESDLPDFAFGGCTELMVHGKSNCGSLEGDLNLPLVLVETLRQDLARCASFDELLLAYRRDLKQCIRAQVEGWNANQEAKARWQPQVLRSLLIDDCIDNAREYNAGGARYNWCVVNVMGLANAIDSLAAVREVVYERREIAPEDLIRALEANFAGHEAIRKRLETCPRFGNDDPRADDLAESLSGFVFDELRMYAPWRGGRYLPSCLMFVTYAMFGKPVGATPDGRRAGAPIADSAGAMQGRDRSGPTALLHSVARIRHHLAPGTLVVNIRLAKSFLKTRASRRKLRELVETYFALGGLQLQINVVDQKTLRDAYEHPENYGDLIIRVGGYSEYWQHLDDDLRRSILERIEHE